MSEKKDKTVEVKIIETIIVLAIFVIIVSFALIAVAGAIRLVLWAFGVTL